MYREERIESLGEAENGKAKDFRIQKHDYKHLVLVGGGNRGRVLRSGNTF